MESLCLNLVLCGRFLSAASKLQNNHENEFTECTFFSVGLALSSNIFNQFGLRKRSEIEQPNNETSGFFRTWHFG